MCSYGQDEEYDEGDKVEKAMAECGGIIKLRRGANVQAELGRVHFRVFSWRERKKKKKRCYFGGFKS